ncbi:hypothetical protein ABTE34_20380, partial [Acinetobacter baumannii]
EQVGQRLASRLGWHSVASGSAVRNGFGYRVTDFAVIPEIDAAAFAVDFNVRRLRMRLTAVTVI